MYNSKNTSSTKIRIEIKKKNEETYTKESMYNSKNTSLTNIVIKTIYMRKHVQEINV